jgi:hypothetical protein
VNRFLSGKKMIYKIEYIIEKSGIVKSVQKNKIKIKGNKLITNENGIERVWTRNYTGSGETIILNGKKWFLEIDDSSSPEN